MPPLKLSGDDAVYLLGSVLMGLRMHGQHDALQASLIHTALQIYELLVCLYFFYLIRREQSRNVELRVHPYSTGTYALMGGGWV